MYVSVCVCMCVCEREREREREIGESPAVPLNQSNKGYYDAAVGGDTNELAKQKVSNFI